MIKQEPCDNCLLAKEEMWANALVCSRNEQVHIGLLYCQNYISRDDVKERAQHIRDFIAAMSDEQLVFYMSLQR